MDLKHSPKLDIKKLIKPSTRDYDAAYTFLEELKVDDIMQEEDMHGILSSFDEIK